MRNLLKKLLKRKPKNVLDVRGLSITEIDELVRKEKPEALYFGDGIQVGVKHGDEDFGLDIVDAVKGEFLSEMTEAEVLDYERKERLGWKNFKLPWHDQ